MRLISAHVANFGKLHDTTVEFEPGFCLFDEPNGWGKSTLAAFIRVMFFGFGGESKRKGLENERKRYEPWQGGAYGGELAFEVSGKKYVASRIFGAKAAGDSFELRDAETNLVSGDFSENLGEEIFKINGESFARTVFLGQNDCVTATTDSINARMGNITDNMNDLDCYEKADAALQDALNKLNPRRKTGTISRMNDEITRLTTEVSQNVSLEDSIRSCEEGEAAAARRLGEMNRERERLFERQRLVSQAQDGKVKLAAYRQLVADCDEREAAYRKARAAIPGEIPTEDEIKSAMDACDGMDRAADRMQFYGEPTKEKKGCGLGMGLALIGVGSMIFGLVLTRSLPWEWVLFVIAGVVAIAAGMLTGKGGSLEEAEKKEHYRECAARYGEQKDIVLGLLRKAGFEAGNDMRAQLQEIWRMVIDLKNLKRAADAARIKKEEFESANDMETLRRGDAGEDLPSMEELNAALRRLDAEISGIKRQADGYGRQLATLREKYDEWQEMSSRLSSLKEERKRLRQQYGHLQLAQKYLAVAKESMTAKYMEPLMSSFSEYYETVTGVAAECYRMDANTKLTVCEQGMQRDTEYLSRGYQDMVGLCLRLALTDAMYQGEKPFLVMDDPLVNLDGANTAGGRRLLRKVAEKYQVVYFTCKG